MLNTLDNNEGIKYSVSHIKRNAEMIALCYTKEVLNEKTFSEMYKQIQQLIDSTVQYHIHMGDISRQFEKEFEAFLNSLVSF